MSFNRVLGFACHRAWVFVLFYGIAAFSFAGDTRSTMYGVQIISTFSFTVGATILAIAARPGSQLSWAKPLIWVASIMMAVGAVLCSLSDTQTGTGMLITGLAGVSTGLGSSMMFVLWMRRFFGNSFGRILVEIGMAMALALMVGLILMLSPFPVAFIVVAAAPIGSALFMLRSMAEPGQTAREPKKTFSKVVLSSSTRRLFARALIGVLLIGGLQGFSDIISGYDTFTMSDMHGVILYVAGIAASLLLIVLGGLDRPNMLDQLYRASILLMCLGYLLMPLMADNYTYVAAVSFAGYLCFIVLVVLTAAYVSRSFMIGVLRNYAVVLGVLYLGEAVGLTLGGAVGSLFIEHQSLVVTGIACTGLLVVTHLYLFTENDLVRIGLGELEPVEDMVSAKGEAKAASAEGESEGKASGKDAPDAAVPGSPMEQEDETAAENTVAAGAGSASQTPAANDDPILRVAAQMAEEYHLSPRESEVLPLLLQGRTMARIQETLFISMGTVSTHVRHIYQKCGVSNKQELLDLAFSKRGE